MKIACMGDSLTYGYGVGPLENWTSLIQQAGNYQLINCGANGDTTRGMLHRFQRDVLSCKPDWVTILGGANDFILGGSVKTVKENLMQMTKQANAHGIHPILLSVPRIVPEYVHEEWRIGTDYETVCERLAETRDWLGPFCLDASAHFIDLYEAFDQKTKGLPYKHFFTDGLHPSVQGHQFLAQIITEHFDWILAH